MSKETQAETLRELDTSARHAPEQAEETYCPVIELRHYLHHPGRRDEFITLFDAYFIEEQERYGAFIPGHFRDRTNPDRFVWLRGFADMQMRRTALHDFYHVSPLWQAHRTAANDTIHDVSNVFLLRPARAATGFRLDPTNRPLKDAEDLAGGVISATIYAFDTPVDLRFVDFFENTMIPLLRSAGATLLGHFVTEPAENTYPALPVREGENVFVWFASFANEAAYNSYHSALTQNQEWITSIVPALHMWGASLEEVLELLPTRRSLLRHHAQEQETRKGCGE
ncbi:MAG TPA: NIPSNAP family containing protein [Ktedonobacteraceae bacterium]|jgi:hypothetical protein